MSDITLEYMCKILGNLPNDWNELIKQARNNQRFRESEISQKAIDQIGIVPEKAIILEKLYKNPKIKKGQALTIVDYKKLISEYHLDAIFEEFVNKNRQLNIKLDPVEQGSESEDYHFFYSLDGRLLARKKLDQFKPEYNLNWRLYKETNVELYKSNKYSIRQRENKEIKKIIMYEYDKVVLINGKPVVFEIKIRLWEGGSRRKKSTLGIKDSLLFEIYAQKLDPISQFFSSQVVYVLIIPKDYFIKQEVNARHSSPYQLFKRRGNYVIPFYTDRSSFEKQVIEFVCNFNLPIRN